MTRRHVTAGIAVLGVIAGLILSSTAVAQDASPAEDRKVTFRWGTVNDIDSFNPLVAVEAPAYSTFYLAYDFLVGFGAADPTEPTPMLAESWTTSPDGLIWTFDIREGVTWHDGMPLTANDIAYTYNRMLDESQGCCVDYLPFIDSITAPNDSTLVIETTRPTVQMLAISVYILPQHLWKDVDKKEAKTYENFPLVGSGAFRTVDWEVGQFWRLEANPDYWGWDVYGNGEPGIDEIIFEVFDNQDALIQALKNGEVDYAANMSASLFDSLEGEPGIQTQASVPTSWVNLVLNVDGDHLKRSEGHPALKDLSVRQAIAYAVDKDAAVERVLRGYGQAGTGVVPPYLERYFYTPSVGEAFPYDPERAKQILDDAGYLDTDGDGVREMPGGGEPLQFLYYIRTEDPDSAPVGELVKGWLEQVGLGVKVQAIDDLKLGDIVYYGEFDMNTWGWGVEPDPDFMLSVFTCGQRPEVGIWNETFYCDPEYDRMYEEQKTLLDPDQRAAAIFEMQRKLYLDVPEVVLFYYDFLEAWRSDRWTGFVQQPAGDGAVVEQFGNWSFLSLRPASEAGGGGTQAKGIPAVIWVAMVAGLLVIGGGVSLARRRGGEDKA